MIITQNREALRDVWFYFDFPYSTWSDIYDGVLTVLL